MRKIIRLLFNRNTLFVILLLIQIIVLVVTILFLSQHYLLVYSLLVAMNFVLMLCILNSPENPSYKLPWLAAMLIVPLFAGLTYLLVKTDVGQRNLKKKYSQRLQETRPFLPHHAGMQTALQQKFPEYAGLAQYLTAFAGYPLYRNRIADYFPEGEGMFESMKNEIRKARKYIFLEFFIIAHGHMWEEILKLLKERASHGVTVRILYDGFGTQFLMPSGYFESLAEFGIECRVFNRFKPFLSSSQNTRDHRKLLIIDGLTAFTGGINIADEYINQKLRFGYWKDGGMMCRGESAWSFTVMFLQLWDEINLEQFRPEHLDFTENDGWIQPFCDSPTDREYVGRNVYLDIISQAKKYVYIMTPYLMPDNELITALGLASRKGIDVRIMTPHIPDKWYAYSTAWSYYRELLGECVRIFEYTPGFIHAKNICADDNISVVGTINLDYRSFYLHFECASVFYGGHMVQKVRDDFQQSLKHCTEITLKDCQERPLGKRISSFILRIFAPLL